MINRNLICEHFAYYDCLIKHCCKGGVNRLSNCKFIYFIALRRRHGPIVIKEYTGSILRSFHNTAATEISFPTVDCNSDYPIGRLNTFIKKQLHIYNSISLVSIVFINKNLFWVNEKIPICTYIIKMPNQFISVN